MAYREPELGYLVRHYPTQAKARVLEAYRQGGGRTIGAAAVLDAKPRTLQRWVTDLGLRDEVDAIRVAHGGRPSTTYNPGGLNAGYTPPRPAKKSKGRRAEGR